MLALSTDLFCEQLLLHGLLIHINASLPASVGGTCLCLSCFCTIPCLSLEVPCSPFAQPLQGDFCVISKHTLRLCTCGIIHTSRGMEATYCRLRDEWIKKMWIMHTVEYYSALKKEGNLYMLQRGRTLRTVCRVKRASHRRMSPV
uniref:Uncharacterized protein n=1 Tax=Rousettus aegyptiacus TaxID=9407 RepID=A0A7J8C2A9_ROUAE|nr:hypothetical protein HJG63_009324 [Rousettus aegyptiacus]